MARNKRLRKKLYLDEFAVYGFGVKAECHNDSECDLDQFLDDFLEMVESRGLLFGGGGSLEDFSGFIVSQKRYESPTKEDKKAVEDWLTDKCTKATTSDFVDAFYDDFD